MTLALTDRDAGATGIEHVDVLIVGAGISGHRRRPTTSWSSDPRSPS